MASVFIGDLDDIIGPSQACVNPIFAGESTTLQQNGAPAEAADKGKAKLTLQASWMEADDSSTNTRPDLIKTQGPGSAATVSLNDCLACRYARLAPPPNVSILSPGLSALGTFICNRRMACFIVGCSDMQLTALTLPPRLVVGHQGRPTPPSPPAQPPPFPLSSLYSHPSHTTVAASPPPKPFSSANKAAKNSCVSSAGAAMSTPGPSSSPSPPRLSPL